MPSDKTKTPVDNRLKCSFCGKSQDQVIKLIAGPGVYICDECVGLCNEILAESDLVSGLIRYVHLGNKGMAEKTLDRLRSAHD